jgi:CTP-dependent riboflavin kinase
MILHGVTASGVGKAAGFTQVPWVFGQLERKLAIRPHPGTFNVRLVDADELVRWEQLRRERGIELEAPASTNCAAVCYPVIVNEQVRGAIIVPGVAGYPPDQVEVIAPVSIRARFGVSDGDPISLTVSEPGGPRS